MIDLSKLGESNSANTALHPRQIFNALPENEYQYPRDVQTEVWNSWHDSRSEKRDTVIKMNTGSGKTIVGLLILKSCLNEDKGPAVYLCPDNYLAKQVRDEAQSLGLSTTSDPRSPRFQGGESILITNIYKLVNGQSQFGVGEININIGSVVVDDVHACIGDTEKQFTLTLGKNVVAEFLSLFESDLRTQSPGGLHEIQRGDSSRELLVPYWAWQRDIDQVRDIISSKADSDTLSYQWPLTNDVLENAWCFISGSSSEVSFRSLPIDLIPSFEDAERRIFMSATISDDSVLISHFDADIEANDTAITPNTASDAGDRLILTPQYLTPSIKDDQIRQMARTYAEEINVVVIVPSSYRVGSWKPYADQILDRSNLADGIRQLKAGHVGLTVLLNKYDGVDLPGHSCELLIIDDLPDARRSIDKYDQVVLRGSGEEVTQPIQQIEQGMGRGVRSSKDYCAVVLMGNRLTGNLFRSGGIEKFTAATQAQYELSKQLGEQLEDEGIDAVEEAIDLFLNRDPEWVQASKSKMSAINYDASLTVRDEVVSRRDAFSAVRRGDLQTAVEEIRRAVQAASSDRLKGLLMQEQAALVNMYDKTDAQALQQSAVDKNKDLLKTIQGVQYKRLSSTAKQAASAFKYLQEEYSESHEIPIAVNQLASRLRFHGVSHQLFESAIQELGRILGFESQRPDAEFSTGPDNLWRSVDSPLFAMECKNEASSNEIAKAYCNQLSGHVNWVKEQYGESAECIPIMLHPSTTVSSNASPPVGMRVISASDIDRLRTSLQDLATALAANWETLGVDGVASQLNDHGLNAGQFASRFTSDFTK